jgi:hypothetical protein
MRRRSWFEWTLLIGAGALVACGGDDSEGASGTGGSGAGGAGTGGSSAGGGTAGGGGSGNAGGGGTGNTGGATNPTCEKGTSAGPVQAPAFWKNLKGETSWFASPLVVDVDKDGKNELVAAYYSVFVYDSQGTLLASAKDGGSRVYAPHVVADLDADGVTEIVVGNGKNVIAYEWKAAKLALKAGWPVDTTTAGNAPEVRGLAAADLNGDGKIEVVATTTQTATTKNGGAQVFVYSADGKLYQPGGISWQAWPRYNNKTGTGNDADRNGQGHNGYGCYGLNVGIGNIDDDPELEILATYDNHHIQAFNHDGVAIDSAPWFKNRDSKYLNQPLTWGQFIRWADPKVESDHYHDHTGQWPHPSWAEWLQWTASPPNVVDLDQDGKNEVVGVPNVEKNEPYETQAYAVMALEGIYGDGSRSAMRKAGWEALPRGGKPISVSGYYPPGGVPAAATIDLQGDKKPEVIVSLNDGHMYAFDAGGKQLWKFSYLFGKTIMYASEPIVADLNQDGSPEVLFSTFGDPDTTDSGHLVILAQDGALLHDVHLPNPGHNGNGNGAPAAPAVGDLDGDGVLEVFVQTFEHGMDIFKLPGSGTKCLLWPTARGGRLRMGQPSP